MDRRAAPTAFFGVMQQYPIQPHRGAMSREPETATRTRFFRERGSAAPFVCSRAESTSARQTNRSKNTFPANFLNRPRVSRPASSARATGRRS